MLQKIQFNLAFFSIQEQVLKYTVSREHVFPRHMICVIKLIFYETYPETGPEIIANLKFKFYEEKKEEMVI